MRSFGKKQGSAADRGKDKTTSVGCPKGPLSGTRGESAREGDPDTPGGARECRSWRREDLGGVGQKILLKIG